MSLKKIKQVKTDRGFRIFDLIIYGAVLVTVAVLFIVLFTTRDVSKLDGVKISVRAEVVFEYQFGSSPEYADWLDVVEDSDGITVTIQTEDGKNVVFIDKTKRTAKMTEADCKGKECMYFEAMQDNSDFIYCSPHGVKVEPLHKDLDNPLIPVG